MISFFRYLLSHLFPATPKWKTPDKPIFRPDAVRAAIDLFESLNVFRTKFYMTRFRRCPLLSSVARVHAEYVATGQQSPGHVDEFGHDLISRVNSVGYCAAALAEHIILGMSDCENIVYAIYESQSCKHALLGGYDDIGVGIDDTGLVTVIVYGFPSRDANCRFKAYCPDPIYEKE